MLVAEVAPKPDVPPSIRKLPKRQQKKGQEAPKKESSAPASEQSARGAESTPSGKSTSTPETSPKRSEDADKRPVVEPLSPSRYKIQFTASEEFREKLERLAALMPGADLASVLEASVTEKLERLEAKRLGKVKNPRKNLEDAETTRRARGAWNLGSGEAFRLGSRQGAVHV